MMIRYFYLIAIITWVFQTSIYSQCVNAGRDTTVCSFNHAVQGLPAGGTWTYLCNDSTLWVEMRDGVPGSVVITVEKCGTYAFVYSVNDIMGCTGMDTILVSFEEPGSQDRSVSYEMQLDYPVHGCPGPPLDSCGHIRVLPSVRPPAPQWTIDLHGYCEATYPMPVLSNLDSSTCLATVNHLGVTHSDSVFQSWTSSQTPLVQTDPSRGIILNNRFDALMTILENAMMAKLDSVCSPFDKCFVDRGICVDTVFDTITVVIPVHVGGYWSLIDSSGIHTLDDTTEIFVNGGIKRLILAKGHRYFGPDDLRFELYGVGGNGETIDLDETTELTFFWTEDWVYDTVKRISERLLFNGNCEPCGSRSLVFDPMDIPTIPSTFCPTITLTFERPVKAKIEGDSVLCQNGFVILSGPPGFASYNWSNGTTSRFNFVTQTGRIYLDVTDDSGCKARDSIFISGVPRPDYEIVFDSTQFCEGNCTDFSVVGNDIASYIWSNGTEDTTAIYCFSDQNITVSVEITDVNGCRYTESFNIDVQPTSPISAGPDFQITCNEPEARLLPDSVGLQAAGYYEWQGPGINAGNRFDIHPVVDMEGTYILLNGPEANSCLGRDTAIVRLFDDRPSVEAGEDRLLNCAVTEVTLVGRVTGAGNPNISHRWEGPDIDSLTGQSLSIQVRRTGKFILFGCNDITGCCATDTVVVTSNTNQPRADAGPDRTLTCDVTAVRLGGVNTSVGTHIIYMWTGPDIDQSNIDLKNPTIQLPGSYFLRVIDTLSKCESVDMVRVRNIGVIPMAKAGNDQVLNCMNNSVTLSSSGSSSGMGIGYEWEGPGITAANRYLDDVTISIPGTYVLLVTDSLGNCRARDTVMVSQDTTKPEIDAGPDQRIDCQTSEVTLLASLNNDNGRMEIIWRGPDIGFGNKFKLNPEVDKGGRYILLVRDTLSECESEDTVFVIENFVPPGISVGADQELNCNIRSVSFSAVLNGFDPAFNDFFWEGPGIDPINRSNLDQTVSVPGIYIANVTAMNENCESADTILITIDTIPPDLDAGQDQVLGCEGDSVIIEVNSSEVIRDIQWTTIHGVIQGPTDQKSITIAAVGEYFVSAVGLNGCIGRDTVNVVPWDEFRLRIDTISGTCAGASSGRVRFGVINGSFPFQFSVDGSPFSPQLIYSGLSGGLHNVVVRDANGCAKSFSFGIPVLEIFNLPEDTIIFNLCEEPEPVIGDDFGYPSNFIHWQDNFATPVKRTINSSGVYVLEFKNDCDSAQIVYDVRSDMIDRDKPFVNFPNAFSPNSDNINDFFSPIFQFDLNDDNVQGYEFSIYNRWGERVYQTLSPLDRWDGTNNGNPANADVYVFVLKGEATDCVGEVVPLQKTGDVTLVR